MAADVFLVIPAFREIHRLPPFLRELAAALSGAPFQTEILVVDDGSPRDEQERLAVAIQPGATGACRVLEPMRLEENHGKGHSIILGWQAGDDAAWLGFLDADGATPADEVVRLLTLATRSATPPPACLWASRIRMLGRRTNRTLGRYLLGRVFANLASQIIGLPVYDSQCGFKLVPRCHYDKVAPLLQEPRFCFDIELLLALHHVGATVVEIPIDWRDVPGGHVHTIRDGLAMLRRLPAIRRRAKSWA
jgi:glycosyltransferase involved in cell wall biosynthesis